MYKLLIVEDEHLIRKWLKYAIDYSKLDIVVVGEARNGQEGSDMIKALLPDIVMTDLNMPLKTGFEMFADTAEYAYDKIVISGYNDFENAKKAIHFQVVDFIAKPIDTTELWHVLEHIVQKRKGSYTQLEEVENYLKKIKLPSYNKEDICINAILEWIHTTYFESFTIANLAHQLGYSESYLYKKFKEELGITINQYKINYRLAKAIERMLEDKALKLYELAEMVGFRDYNYFNRVFKKNIGMNASEFKDKLAK